MKKYVFLFVLFLSILTSNAQDWMVKKSSNPSFIENKGQFSGFENKNHDKILFSVDHENAVICFTTKGLSYHFTSIERENKSLKEIEKERKKELRALSKSVEEYKKYEAEENKKRFSFQTIELTWLGAQTNPEVISESQTSDYHSYSFKQKNGEVENLNHIKAFKKIIYKNLYPNIDIEYSFTEQGNLKYTIIVKAGANPQNIRMLYDKNISISDQGDLHIESKFGDIIDHAPISYYENDSESPIPSGFIKKGKEISFQIPNIVSNKTLIIDPWIEMPAFNTNWDCVWECERDSSNNVYAIGGVYPMQLLKYDPSGNLLWTYNTPYDTSAWLGTFATDLAGNSYVTQGSTAAIQKINTSGSLVWNKSGAGFDEYWSIAFNQSQSRLAVAGTTYSSSPGILNLRGGIFDINTSNGNVNGVQVVTYGSIYSNPPLLQEVRSITSSENGKYYFLSLDTIGHIDQSFSLCSNTTTPFTSLYKTNSTYHLAYKNENYRFNNSGIMAIRADKHYVYTVNGTTLHKRSLSNALIIDSVAIPKGGSTISIGQYQIHNAGIDIDTCGNIYVGSQNMVIKYDSALTILDSVSLNFNVYDLHVSDNGNVIIAGSTGTSASSVRSGYVQSINMSACPPLKYYRQHFSGLCSENHYCISDTLVYIHADSTGGVFSGTGIINSQTGAFNPDLAGVGSHVIHYTLNSNDQDSILVQVDSCVNLSLCRDNYGSIYVLNGTAPYTWEKDSTYLDCSSCPNGNCVPLSCQGSTSNIWVPAGNGNIVPVPNFQPFKVTDAKGNVKLIHNLSEVPICTSSIQETTNSNYINIYPNPIQGKELFIKTNQTLTSVSLYNTIGQLVLYNNHPTETDQYQYKIPLTDPLAKGIYYIHLKVGDVLYKQKIIVL